jgi:Lipase (class 3)
VPWKKPKPLPNIWKYLGRVDWSEATFHQDKALVCCVFSEYAYRHIPQFELASTDRIKLLPCFDYLRLASQGVVEDVREELRRADFGATFVIETERLIALGVETPYVIIIAIRGTKPLVAADWRIDFDAEHMSVPNHDGAFFHRGFYTAIHELAVGLTASLIDLRWRGLPVYVTGHSLGGAMSAILHGFWNTMLPRVTDAGLHSLCAYTFGMPRYANDVGVHSIFFPFHVYRQRDLVPSVPPRALGYADSPDEYLCARHELLPKYRDDQSAAVQAMLSMPIPGFILRTHSIEGYRRRIHRIVDETDSKRKPDASQSP